MRLNLPIILISMPVVRNKIITINKVKVPGNKVYWLQYNNIITHS